MKYPQLQNKVVVVTGASRGLGKAIAKSFAENNCTVWLASRSIDHLTAVAKEIGHKTKSIQLDVTNPSQVNYVANLIAQEEGVLDVWVNNAGGEKKYSVIDLKPLSLQEITALNYFGVVYGTQAAAKQMIKQKQGDIVQIISTSAFTPRENESAYCSAKAAASMFTECAQKELKEYGIRLIPIYPGGIKTDFFKSAGAQLPTDSMEPEDIADIILNAVCQPRNIIVASRIFRNS